MTRSCHDPCVDNTTARPAPISVRTTVVRCLGSFIALLVVFGLITQGLLDDQPGWRAALIAGLLALGAVSAVEMIDGGVRWLWARWSRWTRR